MSILRTGVVGVGHMGVNHARIYSELANCTLSAVYDQNHDAARQVAKKYRTHAASSLEEFAGLVDAATICTPTVTHYEIGAFLLERGKHLLVEKPVADTPARARALSELAASRSCVLQVGHIERFNPVLTALEGKLNNPRFLEVTRLSPYPESKHRYRCCSRPDDPRHRDYPPHCPLAHRQHGPGRNCRAQQG